MNSKFTSISLATIITLSSVPSFSANLGLPVEMVSNNISNLNNIENIDKIGFFLYQKGDVLKVYDPSDEDFKSLVIDRDKDDRFYKIMGNNKFIDVFKRDKEEIEVLSKLFNKYGVDSTSEKEIDSFIKEHGAEVNNELNMVQENATYTFEEITSLNKPSDIISGVHYELGPTLGEKDFSTKFHGMKENFGIWKYKLSDEPIEIVTGKKYDDFELLSQNESIVVLKDPQIESFYSYLNVIIVDDNGFANYAKSFKINKENINIPMVTSEEDNNISFSFEKGVTPGHSRLKDNALDLENWHIAVLDEKFKGDIYETTNFPNSIKLSTEEFLSAEDAELDSLDDIKKYAIVYFKEDNKVKRYKYIDLDKNNIKGLNKADKLNEDIDIALIKGNIGNTTQIEKPTGNIRYVFYDNKDKIKDIPYKNRVYPDSIEYMDNKNIKVKIGGILRVIIADENNCSISYGDIIITEDMVEKPSAEIIYGIKISKGNNPGDIFIDNQSISHENLYYSIDDKIMNPQFGQSITDINIQPIDQNTIKIDDFTKYEDSIYNKILNIYSVADSKVVGHTNFIINSDTIRMNPAISLDNIIKIEKGNSPGTTKIISGINSNEIYLYNLSNDKLENLEINTIIDGVPVNNLKEINTGKSKYLNVFKIVKQNGNRLKAFTSIELTEENTMAPYADKLISGIDFIGPIPGSEFGSTKFTRLLLTDGNKIVYDITETEIKNLEKNSEIKNLIDVSQNKDIIDTKIKSGNYLNLYLIDANSKLQKFISIRLTDDNIKGLKADKLDNENAKIISGNTPGSIKLELSTFGQTDIRRWQYKLLKSNDEYIPSKGQRLIDGVDYRLNSEILVEDYSHILITGNDNNNRVLYYKILEIENKKSFADLLEIILSTGSSTDTTMIKKITSKYPTNNLKYSVSSNQVNQPGEGDNPPKNLIDYKINEDISILPNEYINLYSLDENNKIKGFISKKVEESQINSSKIEITPPDDIPEEKIVNGGEILSLTIENGSWNQEILTNEFIRNEFIEGFTANSEAEQWNRVISELKKGASGAISITDNTIKVGLPSTKNFNITKKQIIEFKAPLSSIKNSKRAITASNNISINPTISATLSGDFVSDIVREDDIKNGGKKIIITLKDGNWILDNNKLNTILDNQNNELLSVKSVTRTNNNTLTIILDENSKATVNNQIKNIDITILKEFIQNGTDNIKLNKPISIYPNILKIEAELASSKSLEVLAPEYKVLDPSKNKLDVIINSGTLKDRLENNMISFNNLPRGLRYNIKRIDDKNLEITFSGNASSEIKETTKAALVIKGNAITEPNSIDSDPIDFDITRSSSIMDELKKVDVNISEKKLISKDASSSVDLNNNKIEFAINASSFNNIKDNEWTVATDSNTNNLDFKSGMIFVRSKDNPREYYQVTNLREPGFSERVTLESVNYDESNKLKINFNLKDDPILYEYKIDDTNWIELTSRSIELDNLTNENKLRKILFRLKATKDNLPSKSSNPIDFVTLNGVDYDLSGSKIIPPESIKNSMEFSINSSNGKNGSWSSNMTNIDFTKGSSLYIRQKGNNNNFRKLIDNIKYMDSPMVKPTYNIKNNKISHTENNIEFKYSNDSNWTSIETDTRVEFKPGEIHYRTIGDKNNLPSKITESTKIIIDNPENPPEIKAVDLGGNKKEIQYLSDSGWEKIDDNFQYKIGLTRSEWQAGSSWDGSKVTDDIAVSVRQIATEDKLPSNPTTVNFKKDIVLDIKLDIPNRKILATNTNMEYNIATEETAPISNWITAKNNSTDISLYPGTFIWVREKNKPNSAIKLNTTALEKATVPAIDDIEYDIKNKTIKNTKDFKLDYKIGNDPWKTINPNETLNESNGVDFKPGKFLIRTSATDIKLESDPISIMKITTASSKPKVEIDDVKNKIVSIDGLNVTENLKTYEFKKKNDVFWINTSVLKDVIFDGDQEILVRKAATQNTLPSEATALTFTKNMDLSNVLLNIDSEPYSLKGTNSNMEYRILFEDDDPNKKGWLTCSNIETILPDWIKVSIENVDTQKTFKSLTIRDKRNSQEKNQIVIIEK